jgi:hypothetical protein
VRRRRIAGESACSTRPVAGVRGWQSVENPPLGWRLDSPGKSGGSGCTGRNASLRDLSGSFDELQFGVSTTAGAIPARRGCALCRSCPEPENHQMASVLGRFFSQKNARFLGCFASIRSVRPQGLRRVTISQQRRNSLEQNSLSRHATDRECCKRDAHQRVFGPCGRSERRE